MPQELNFGQADSLQWALSWREIQQALPSCLLPESRAHAGTAGGMY